MMRRARRSLGWTLVVLPIILGVASAQHAQVAPRDTTVVTLIVESVIAGSPAAEQGILVDDLLTHVDSEPVDVDDVHRIRETLKSSGDVRLTLQRGDETIEATLTLRRLI